MAQNISHFARLLANILRGNSEGREIRASVSESAEESLAARPRGAPLSNSDNPDMYLKFFKVAMEFDLSPHMKCHLRAEAIGVRTRADAWKWIPDQVTSPLTDLQWLRAHVAGNICVISPRISRRLGMRRYPWYQTIGICTRRMESNHCELATQPDLLRNDRPSFRRRSIV